MNLKGGSKRGLKRISILATGIALLLFAILLVTRRATLETVARFVRSTVPASVPAEAPQSPEPGAASASEPAKAPKPERNAPAPPDKTAKAVAALEALAPAIAPSGGSGPDRFVLRDQNVSAFFTDRGVRLAMVRMVDGMVQGAHALHWGLQGAAVSEPRPRQERASKIHRFRGNDASGWQANLPTYSEVYYEGVRPGIDLQVESRPHGLKYTLQAKPGADVADLQFRYEGAHGVRVNAEGSEVLVDTEIGTLVENELRCWQDLPAGRVGVDARYVGAGRDGVRIEIGAYDPAYALTIDPIALWGTFVGGSMNNSTGYDYGRAIAYNGAVYVGGYTSSPSFPTTVGVYDQTLNNSLDCFISRLDNIANPMGLVWSTVFGGTSTEYLRGLKLDPSGNVVIVGMTYSNNLPTTGGVYQPFPGSALPDGFVAKFTPSGGLLWSTYLGGTAADYVGDSSSTNPCNPVAVDSSFVYVVGSTLSTGLATAGVFDTTQNGGMDVFVAKLNSSNGTLAFYTYLGGDNYDYGSGIALDGSSNIYITGRTSKSATPVDYPTTINAYRQNTAHAGGYDVYLTKLNSNGTGPLQYSTLIGGAGTDEAYSIAVDSTVTPALAYITGKTNSAAWPTTAGVYQPALKGGYDCFVAKFDTTNPVPISTLNFSTFIGGVVDDVGASIRVNSSPSYTGVYVVGWTRNDTVNPIENFPVPNNAFQKDHAGGTYDGFLFRMPITGAGPLTMSTFLGSAANDQIYDLHESIAYGWLVGQTDGVGFPVNVGAYDTTLNGQDVVAMRFDMLGNGALLWSTFLGGANGIGSTYGRSVAIGTAGNAVLLTETTTIDFPTTVGAWDTSFNGSTSANDLAVTKLDSDGSHLWSTYLGGDSSEYGGGITISAAGDIFVTGYSYSTNFPTVNAYQPGYWATPDAIVTRLNGTGNSLVYSTYLGGSGSEYGYAIAAEGTNAYVVGVTTTPTTAGFPATVGDTTNTSGGDAFVTKINTALSGGASLVWSRYLGGDAGYEEAYAVAVDASGASYITGITTASDASFAPTLGAYDQLFDFTTGEDMFVIKIKPLGNTDWMTYLGGSNYDYPRAIAVDSSGNVIVSGFTQSPDFPVGGYQTLFQGGTDCFVTKLYGNDGSDLDWSTFLGGSGYEEIHGMALDSSDNVYVTGFTDSFDFPVMGGLDPTYEGSQDAFVTRINSNGYSLSWSTYLGEENTDYGYAIGVMPTGHVVAAGYTYSYNFPVGGGGFDTEYSGSPDAWVLRIDNEAPTVPSSLAQYRSDGFTGVSAGGATNELTVVFKGICTDAEGDLYKLQVEVEPVGTAFNNVPTSESGLTFSGVTASLSVGGLVAGTQYHWQARAVDENGVASGWISFGLPPETNTDFRVDQTNPSISITTPATDPYYTNGGTVTLSGTASDDVAIQSVTWSNAATSGSGTATGNWTAAGISLAPGANNITVTVQDTAGNPGNRTIQVIFDPTPPTVTITSPTSLSTWIQATSPLTTLAGTYSDNISVTNIQWVNTANGLNASFAPVGGTWSVASITLVNGLNTINVTATDIAGNTSVDSLTVTYDPVPPGIAVSNPPFWPYNTSATSFTVTGTATDSITSVTQVNWNNLTTGGFGTAGGTTNWTTPPITLNPGSNTIRVTAFDAAGNSSFIDVVLVSDTIAPTATITNPTSNPTHITNLSSIPLGGSASDTGGSGLSMVQWSNAGTGGNGTAAGTTSWSVASVGLVSGSNVITVTATDGAGNVGNDVITVTYDPIAPSVTITTPSTNPLYTTASNLGLAGTSTDNVSVSVVQWQINNGGYAATSGTPASWNVPAASVLLVAGTNTIDVRATDTAGNTFVRSTTVIRDNTNPTVNIVSPASNPFYTSNSSLPMNGTASDAIGLQIVEWRNVTTGPLNWFSAGGPASWSIAGITLVSGPNLIEIRATDLAGNQGIASITATLDTTPPSASITSPGPADFATNATPAALGGTASDGSPVTLVEWSNNGGPYTNATGTNNWTASIPLSAGTNNITIRATDAAGNQGSDSILVTLDQTNPSVTITTPSVATTYTTAASVPVSGTSSDNVAVSVVQWRLNGGFYAATSGPTNAWNIPGGSFTLVAGSNTLDVRATDTAGNTFTASRTIIRDNTNPTVAFTTPSASPFYTSASPISLAGTAADALPGVVSQVEWQIDGGGFAPAAGTTSWSVASVPLTVGSHTIDVRSWDAAGNSSAISTVTVIRDTANPVVAITSPGPSNFSTNATPVALGGTATDGSPITQVQWQIGGGPFNNATGTNAWTASIPLSAGSNLIAIRATDAAGNQGTTTITVTLDQTNPTVTFTTPTAPTTYTQGTDIPVSGSSSDNVAVSVVQWRLNGGTYAATSGPTNAWTIPAGSFTLLAGSNTLDVRATDTAGNTFTASRTIVKDNTAPAVTITNPASNPYYTNVSSVTLTGTASDTFSISVIDWQINGGPFSTLNVSGTTSWTITSIGLPLASNTIVVRATDQAGNQATTSITVNLDQANPVVAITSPGPSNFSTNATPVALGGTATDGSPISQVQWQVGGGPFNNATGTNSWTASIPLSAGPNSITIRATDAAGNLGTTSITVTLDQTNPSVTFVAPSAPTTYTQGTDVPVNGTSSDNVAVSVVQWRLNGGTYAATSGTVANWNIPAGSFTLLAGSNTLDVRATDTAGNTFTASRTIVKDNTAPAVAITTPASNPYYTSSTTVNLAGTSSDTSGIQMIEWQINAGGFGTLNVTGTTSWTISSISLPVAANTIQVRATDQAGNQATTTLTVNLDQAAPTVVITTNSGTNFATNVTPAALAGTATDGSPLTIVEWSNNGGPYSGATGTGSWTASIPLAAGANNITVRATDAAGNQGIDTIIVTFDSSAPTINITGPTTNPTYVTNNPSLTTLAGNASDASGISEIKWRNNGGAFVNTGVVGTTSWTIASVSLVVGTNTIDVQATDTGLNTSVDTIVVTLDQTNPVATITTNGGANFATQAISVNLAGTASDNVAVSGIDYRVNGGSFTISGVVGTPTAWGINGISLPSEGVYTIDVRATDSANNTFMDTIVVTKDNTAPLIAVSTPASGTVRNTTPVAVTGTASDVGGSGVASVSWFRAEGGGASGGTSGPPTAWNTSLPLVAGLNTFTFTSTDAAGNTSNPVAVWTVTLDQTNPVVTISTNGGANFAATGLSVNLAGSSSDNITVTAVEWRVNGGGYSAGGFGGTLASWTFANIPIGPGEGIYTIDVRATDSALNTSIDTIVVTKDNTPPVVAVSSPASGLATNTTPVPVNGTAGDVGGSGVASVEWSRAESGPVTGTAIGTTSWNASLPLVGGVNTFTITSIDAAGNVSSPAATWIVTLDLTNPAVTINTNGGANFATMGASVNLDGSSSDNLTVTAVEWRVNGGAWSAAGFGGTLSAWTFANIPIGPLEGAFTIDIRATDSASNTSIDTIVVTKDNTNPFVEITSPTNIGPPSAPPHFTTGSSSILLGGNSNDGTGSGLASATWFRLEGGPVPPNSGAATGTTNWSASVPLVAGPNTITITVTDLAGNTATDQIVVQFDATAATVDITIPTTAASFNTSSPTITIGGTGLDSDSGVTTVEWSLNGAPGPWTGVTSTTPALPLPANTPFSWSAVGIPLAVGSNTITVRAGDGVIFGFDTITVIHDPTNPTVDITTNGGANFATNVTPFVFAGTASDNVGGAGLSLVSWANAATSGSGNAAGTGSWSASIPLTTGPNLITLTARDGANNTGTDTITVTYDPGLPIITITTNGGANIITSGVSVNLAGTASDNLAVASIAWRIDGGGYGSVGVGGTPTAWTITGIGLAPAGPHTIDVRVTDTAGNTSIDTIVVTRDDVAPSLAIVTPAANPLFTTAASVNLSGTSSDDNSVSLIEWRIDAGGFTTAGVTGTTSWAVTGVALSSGAHTIEVRATDAAGRTTVASTVVNRDTTSPTLSITTPTSSPTHQASTATVDLGGTASDNLTVTTVTWVNSAGGSGTAAGTTSWTAALIALSPGANVISVTATDSAGNTSTDVITVTYDTTVPLVTIVSPTTNPTHITGSTPLAIGGTASDDLGVAQVEWRVVPAAFTVATGTTSWSASVPLVAGSNTIEVRSKDTAGNFSAIETLTVTLDDSFPTVDIVPGTNFATNVSPASLAGTAADAGLTSVTWSNAATGGSGTATGTTNWTASVPLAIGANLITVTATDSAGNVTTDTITVTLDTTVPSVTITGPTASPTFITNGANINLSGSSSDNISVALVEWFRSEGSLTGPTGGTVAAWTANVPLIAGTNTITIRATDSAGNISTDVITVTQDPTDPTVTITIPTSSGTYLAGSTPLTIGGTASDNDGVASVIWSRLEGPPAASGTAAGTTSWSASVPLLGGTNTFTVTATDRAGRTSNAVLVVTHDVTAPAITITTNSGNDFATNSSPAALVMSASDANGIDTVAWSNAATGGTGAATFSAPDWNASIPLAIGGNLITVTATDNAGRTNTDTIVVTFDTAVPNVTITGPTASPTFTWNGANINLSGSSSDNISVALVEWLRSEGSLSGATGGTVAAWTATVPLIAGTNTITIRATDSAGNISTDVITVTQDSTLPVVTITSPTAAATYLSGSATVNLGGAASDNVGVSSVSWVRTSPAGASGTAAGTTSWSASVPLMTGPNIIEVTAIDTATNASVVDTITVTYDDTNPAIAITTNSGNDFATNASPALLDGTVSDANGVASVTWSNAATGGIGSATVAAGWSASIPLAIGDNLITVTATDNAGMTSSDTITVTFDTALPTVTITGPTSSPNHVEAGATVTLSGSSSDNLAVASVGWSRAEGSLSGGTTGVPTAWTGANLPLIAGTNTFTITAIDSAGNTSTDVITVIQDPTDPVITITSPTSDPTYLTGGANLLIGGTASDNVAISSVTWVRTLPAGPFGTAAGTTSWSASVPLNAGSNTIVFTVTDTAGRTSTDQIVVTRDTAAPTVDITGPTPLSTWVTNGSPIALSGTATDTDGVYGVSWVNAATGGAGSANFTAPNWTASVPLAVGVNNITVTVTDLGGNTTNDSIDVTFDVTTPTVTISAPTVQPTHVVQAATVDLGGTASDNVGIQGVSWVNASGGSGGAVGGAAWNATNIPLVVGPNVITVTVLDSAGNTSTDVITVTRDGTPPGVVISGPTLAPTYVTNATPLTLSGTATDNVGLSSVTWSRLEGPPAASGTATGTSVWTASVPLLSGTNTFTVTATDTAGGTTTAQIVVTYDAVAPLIDLNSPTINPSYATNSAPILIGGTATDGVGLAGVAWSNSATGGFGAATLGVGTWSATVPLTNGINPITVTATDNAGNTTTDTLSVNYDAIVPSATINGPTSQPTFITPAASIALAGTSNDNTGVFSVAWFNAATATGGTAVGTLSWSEPSVLLAPGENVITVTVTDDAGNIGTDTITVRQDAVAPAVAINQPTAGPTFVTNSTPLAIAGTSSDNVAVASVSWSRAEPGPLPLVGTATGTALWSASVPLIGGPNTFTVTATDTAGNTSSVVLTVTLDSTAPTVTPTGPSTLSTAVSSVTLSGTADDPGGTLGSVTWSNSATGGSGTATGTASWSAAIPLTPGVNIITITVRDAAGNIVTDTITVIHDTQAPTITISTPTSAAAYNSPSTPLTVGGSASDNVGVITVTWLNSATGSSGTAIGTGTWTADIGLLEGSNQITVTAADDVGNTSSDTITVSYDPTPPTINITSPTTNPTFSTTTSPVDLSGTASDNIGLTSVTWANTTTGTTGTASGTSSWNCSVPLQSGPNVVVLTATDAVGNLTTDTLTVTYDITPPTVVIVSPAPPTFTTQTRPLAISGTATDNVGVQTVTWSNGLTGNTGTATFLAPNWNASIPLSPGANLITIRASDALGNIGQTTLNVDYSHELVPPGITIVTPAPPTYTSPTQLVAFAGTASDNVGVASVTWVNQTTRVTGVAIGTTNWTAEVPLANGDNFIVFTAWDTVANTVTASITVTFASAAESSLPSISITAPTSTDTYDTTVSPLYLECDALDDTGIVAVTWTNQGSYGDGVGAWGTVWYASIPLVAGQNQIYVTAIDPSGNIATDYITVNYTPPLGDPIPPIVNITSPSGGPVNLTVPTVNLAGTATDNNQVDAVTIRNTATGAYVTATGTASWAQAGMALNPGVNVIEARAIDPSGNVGLSTLVAVYTPPAAAAPVAPVIPAGALCGCLGLEALLPILLLGALRRRKRLTPF